MSVLRWLLEANRRTLGHPNRKIPCDYKQLLLSTINRDSSHLIENNYNYFEIYSEEQLAINHWHSTQSFDLLE